MEAIALIFSKFSDELISAQIALLSLSLCLSIYWMLIRKKKRETAEWVPAALVRAYLDRMHVDERETRLRLFGEGAPAPVSMPSSAAYSAPMATTTIVTAADPALAKELEALRAQLSMADQRAMEFDRMLNGLRAEKTALEQKLRDAIAAAASAAAGASGAPGAAAGAAPAGPNPVQQKEIDDLKAKLDEYQLLEDEIAELKKYRNENEQLRQKVSQYESGAAGATVLGGAPAAPVSATVIPNATMKIETPVTVVSGGAAPVAAPTLAPAPAPAEAAPVAAAPVPEKNTDVLQPVAVPEVAGDKSPKQKEAELLSEFEKMLAS
jgi:hypothetical protein